MYALFDTMIDPESRRYLSEDYTFCRLWQQMGGEVFLDPRTGLNHVGHYTFRGNVRKMLTGESTSSNYQSPDQRPFVIGVSDGNRLQKQQENAQVEEQAAPQEKLQISKNK